MTHFERKYDLTDPRPALVDTLDYIGAKRYRIIARMIGSGEYTDAEVRLAASFAGVQGFPITAMLHRYHPRVK